MPNLLDSIEDPKDIRRLTIEQLKQLASEIREEVISVVSEVGGHFASTLGAVELTLALHYVFNTPEDRIVWDTGHQAYAHKLICGRRNRLATIRQLGGLSGFLSRDESEYDVFGAGHAGTSISAALGMVEAKTLESSSRKVVAVISDGGLSAGLTYEGLNQGGHLEKDLIVVLNDNAIFIDPRVGAVSSFLSKQFTTDFGVRLQKNLSTLLRTLPKGENLFHLARKVKDSFLGLVTPGFLFESLGFQYVGPIDGHNIEEMITTLENVKKIQRPTLVHVLTTKGKGYPPAEKEPVKFHGVTPFHVLTGKPKKDKGPIPTYTDIFGESLIRLAKENPKVIGITAAMGSGTGIDKLSREIPKRSTMSVLPNSMPLPLRPAWPPRGLYRWWRSTQRFCKGDMTKFCMTSAYKICTWFLLSIAAGWSARMVRRITVFSILHTCVQFRISLSWRQRMRMSCNIC
jgi:1-deoxy-D-xylulose-5-phosphate synthase